MHESRRRILEHLRESSTATVEDFAVATGLAPVTVRHHLNVLRERGLLDVGTEPVGRGRPRHLYRLSPEGAQSLSDERYDGLARRLLDMMMAGDRGAAEQLFRTMARGIAEEHRPRYEGRGLEARLDTVRTLLSEEGFAVEWERDGEDFLVRELACPYRTLSETHHEVCAMDEQLIAAVTGQRVTRERWRRDGESQCVYRVHAAPPGDAEGQDA